MNSDLYFVLSTKAGGLRQYPDDFRRASFKKYIGSCNDSSCLVISRDSNIVEYLYLRRLNDAGDSIFGICVVINGALTYKLRPLFRLFEKKYEQLVTEGSLLCFDSDGNITIDEHGWDYPDSICSDYNRQFDDSFTENFNHFCAIPPINYAARDECVTICLVDDDASMREAIDKYNTVIVVKSPVSPSLTFNGYAVKIARLNNELELKNQLIKELQDSRNGHGVGSGTIAWVLFFIVIFLVLISIFTGVLTIQL